MFFPAVSFGRIFPLNKQREFVSPTPFSALADYLCRSVFPYMHYVSSTVYFIVPTAVFFPFNIFCVFPAYPQHPSSPYYLLLYTTNLLICVLFCLFNSSSLCSAPHHLPLHIYIDACAQNHSRQNPQCSMAYVPNTCSTSTSWCGPLPYPSCPFRATIMEGVGGPARSLLISVIIVVWFAGFPGTPRSRYPVSWPVAAVLFPPLEVQCYWLLAFLLAGLCLLAFLLAFLAFFTLDRSLACLLACAAGEYVYMLRFFFQT